MSFNTRTIMCVGSLSLLPVVTLLTRKQPPVHQNMDHSEPTESVCTANINTIRPKHSTKRKMSTLSTLNPKAQSFVPSTDYSSPPTCLLPIQEEYWKQQPLYPSHSILRCKYIIFISPIITKHALETHLFEEYFDSDTDLFYHLRYQCKMQVIDGLYKLFRCCDQQLVVFNTELYHVLNGTKAQVFIVAQPNDEDKQSVAPWKMIQFMTAFDIHQTYNINTDHLPSGSRMKLYQELRTQMLQCHCDLRILRNTLTMDNMKRMSRIGQIKAEKNVTKVKKTVTYAQLLDCIRDSIEGNALRPIIWFDKKKENRIYRVQMLLPIELEDGCYIGITFDYDNKKQIYAVKFCIDNVDIRRKLALYKPAKDENEYKMFSNNISEIRIVDDADLQLIWKQKRKIKSLESIIREKDEEIEKLKDRLVGV